MNKLILALAIMTVIVAVRIPSAFAIPFHPDSGNPHDYRPGPPIASCSADLNQGPPDDLIKGCFDTPFR